MQKIHDGDCENHAGGRSLTHKVINQGYDWPKIFDDAMPIMPNVHPNIKPAELLPSHLAQSMALYARGLEVAGSLSQAQPQLRFLLILTDYFTKWIETVLLFEIRVQQIVEFLCQNIVCRFGIPHTVISYNGTNFAGK